MKNLVEELKVTKEQLYDKFNEYENYNRNLEPKMSEDWIASTVFGIDFQNKVALYFLILGLKSMEKGIDFVKEGGLNV